ncbi:MAG: T9SS type A sorting domain-containing protein, partial [candidate division WOR-3 bacterium]
CRGVPGGLSFRTTESFRVSIYASDGRLVYVGQLSKGNNRISLNPGVYLWIAGPRKGVSAVR